MFVFPGNPSLLFCFFFFLVFVWACVLLLTCLFLSLLPTGPKSDQANIALPPCLKRKNNNNNIFITKSEDEIRGVTSIIIHFNNCSFPLSIFLCATSTSSLLSFLPFFLFKLFPFIIRTSHFVPVYACNIPAYPFFSKLPAKKTAS